MTTTTQGTGEQTGTGAVGASAEPGLGTSTPGVASAGGPELAADVAALEEIVSRLASRDAAVEQLVCSGVWLGEAAVRLHRVVQRLTGVRLQWLLAEDADGRWALGGARTFAQHVAHTHRVSQARARSEVRLARQLRDAAGLFGQAVRRGDVGMEHAEILARGALTSQERIAGLQAPMRAGGDDRAPGAARGLGSAAGDGAAGDAAAGDGAAGDGACGANSAGGGVGGDGGAAAGRDDDGAGDGTVEEFLLGQARGLRVEDFRRLVRHYAAVSDPEADERGYRKAQEKEHVQLAQTLDGFHIQGFLTEEHGQQVRVALDAVMGSPAPGETRSGARRRAQALADMARVVLDQGLAGTAASVRPHLGVVIGPEQFAQMVAQAAAADSALGFSHDPGPAGPGSGGPGSAGDGVGSAGQGALVQMAQWDWAALLAQPPAMWSDASGPVPIQVLRRMARCGDVYRVLFSPDNEIINHGRAHRVFTAAQRRAIIARDRHCTFPGCSAPPALCETHHARVRWRDNGATDVHNGALLCFYHHDLVESRGLSMSRADGTWRFHRRDGTQVHTADGASGRSGTSGRYRSDRLVPWQQRE